MLTRGSGASPTSDVRRNQRVQTRMGLKEILTCLARDEARYRRHQRTFSKDFYFMALLRQTFAGATNAVSISHGVTGIPVSPVLPQMRERLPVARNDYVRL